MKMQKFSLQTTSDLEDWGVVRDPLTQPACRVRGKQHAELEGGTLKAGIWECTPGRFRRALFDNEFMHIVSGECTFTPEGGEPVVLRAGDSFSLSADVQGVWEVLSTMRKLYAISDAK
jgi:uncharacterized cupin superfamily protein